VNPLSKVKGLGRNKKALAVVGLGGAAALALVSRKKRGGDPKTAAADQATSAGISGGYDAVANEVFRVIGPQLTELQRQINSVNKPVTPTVPPPAASQLAHLRHVTHLRQQAIEALRRQAALRANPALAKSAADVKLLTPAQQHSFRAFIRGSAAQAAKGAASIPTTLPARSKTPPASYTGKATIGKPAPRPTRRPSSRATIQGG
jgi:hypothetical protein